MKNPKNFMYRFCPVKYGIVGIGYLVRKVFRLYVAAQPKKTLILNILNILKSYTDGEHRLRQKDIIDILQRDYSMTVDRKAVSRNLTDLKELGYGIEYDNGWYIQREFEDSELRLLIDSVLFSKHIPHSQCKELIEKLKGLSSGYFDAKVGHIRNVSENQPENKQLFYTTDILDEAIRKGRQVSLTYNQYGTDKVLHPTLNSNGEIKKYIINPYQIAAANSRYYLICNFNKYDNVANLRLDRITDIQLLDTPAKDMRKVKGLENGLDLPKHMAEHIYMHSGDSVWVTFRAVKDIISDIIDWFGNDVTFSDETDKECVARVKVNENAMFCWAMQYGEHVEVLKPERLREKIKNAVKSMSEKYRREKI